MDLQLYIYTTNAEVTAFLKLIFYELGRWVVIFNIVVSAEKAEFTHHRFWENKAAGDISIN